MEARHASEESAKIFSRLQDPNCAARSALVVAEVFHAIGDHSFALRHAEDAAAAEARLGFHQHRATALWLAGRCHEANGNRDAARRAYFEGMRAVAKTSVTSSLAGLVESIAGTHPGAPAAPRLLGFAAAAREAVNVSLLPSDRADQNRWVTAVRGAHRHAFESEFAAGRSMTHDDAIAMALALESAA